LRVFLAHFLQNRYSCYKIRLDNKANSFYKLVLANP
jgi:hypothetical protein